nr:DUF2264 domain-containing protein [Kineosporia mesophila]
MQQLEDRDLSPFTGWTRRSWALLADEMLLSVRPFLTPARAGIDLPGPPGRNGHRVDLLEGFARTFLAAGFRIAGERGSDPHGFLGQYAQGLAAGVDPASPERWVRLDEHGQAKVEAASIALVLHLTRPWLWDGLPERTREQTVTWLSGAVGAQYPANNWAWFRIVVNQFLKEVGGPWSPDDLDADLAFTDSLVREHGWSSDGTTRAFDHYAGWALQLYPLLWSELAAGDPAADARRGAYVQRADQFLEDAVGLVGADGSPLLQGRSLTYRFAAAAPFWAGARARVPSSAPGLLRRAASGMARHFVEAGAPDERGLLSLGWHSPWPRIAQTYSGPASPYWASKAFLGLSLPAGHPAWTAPEEPLPVEKDDTAFVVAAAGWLVAGRRHDGTVRVVNHGTDHARPGDLLTDAPWYARLAYSTATAPVISRPDERVLPDQSVVLVDRDGHPTSRTGFDRGRIQTLPGGTLYGSSSWRASWIDPDPPAHDHGAGRPGTARPGPRLSVASLVHGDWEVRTVRLLDDPDDPRHPGQEATLRLSGWAVAQDRPSRLVVLEGLDTTGDTTALDATPFDALTHVPWAQVSRPRKGSRYTVALALNPAQSPPVLVPGTTPADDATVLWADGWTDDLTVPGYR